MIKKREYSYQREKDILTLEIRVVGVEIAFLWIKTSLQSRPLFVPRQNRKIEQKLLTENRLILQISLHLHRYGSVEEYRRPTAIK